MPTDFGRYCFGTSGCGCEFRQGAFHGPLGKFTWQAVQLEKLVVDVVPEMEGYRREDSAPVCVEP